MPSYLATESHLHEDKGQKVQLSPLFDIKCARWQSLSPSRQCQVVDSSFISSTKYIPFFLSLSFFLWLPLWHMKVPGPETELVPQR